MKKVLQKISIASLGVLTPALVFAQGGTTNATRGIAGVLRDAHTIISLTIPVLISLAVLAFMWGVVLYLFKPDKSDGKMFMLWGVIALFVMTSVWGLVGILRGTFIGQSSENQVDNNIQYIPNQR